MLGGMGGPPPGGGGGAAPGGLIQALASRGLPNAPDNPQAKKALDLAVLALHQFLDNEKDPQDRAAVTQCLAKLESIRGKKMTGQNLGGQAGGPSGPQNNNGPGGSSSAGPGGY